MAQQTVESFSEAKIPESSKLGKIWSPEIALKMDAFCDKPRSQITNVVFNTDFYCTNIFCHAGLRGVSKGTSFILDAVTAPVRNSWSFDTKEIMYDWVISRKSPWYKAVEDVITLKQNGVTKGHLFYNIQDLPSLLTFNFFITRRTFTEFSPPGLEFLLELGVPIKEAYFLSWFFTRKGNFEVFYPASNHKSLNFNSALRRYLRCDPASLETLKTGTEFHHYCNHIWNSEKIKYSSELHDAWKKDGLEGVLDYMKSVELEEKET